MANPEHLAILKKGVEVWNAWRERNPDVVPDLRKADLRMWDLRAARLAGVLFNKASLMRTNLVEADLRTTEFTGADLAGAILNRADLRRACAVAADFVGAYLIEANLENADLEYSRLCESNFARATLTGVKLYASARDDWVIEDVKCKYVYWDWAGKNRSPKNRDFAPGEFEQIYKSLPTIEYVFQHGMTPLDPLIMDRVVQAIREQNPEFDIKVDSISARGLGPSIRFTVQQEEHKDPALQMVVTGYESRVQRLEAEKNRLYNLLGRAIDKTGTRLIEAGPGAVVAMDNASVNIEQHIHQAVELQKAIAELPPDSPTFAKVAKKTALDIIGGALKDVAKGQVKEAAKQIYELGKDLGAVVLNTAAYAFFRNIMQGG